MSDVVIPRLALPSNNWIELYRTNLLWNLHQYQRYYPGVSFSPVLKSNASGHGIIEVAKILEREPGIPFFCVNALFEAHNLRSDNVVKKILVIGYSSVEDIVNCSLQNISFVITSLHQLKLLARLARSCVYIHLKIDTGMNRQGVLLDEIGEALAIIQNTRSMYLEGVCSHFADADNPNPDFTNKQILLWNRSVSLVKDQFESIEYIHAAATPSAIRTDHIYGNLIRVGIGLFGIDTAPEHVLQLRPIMQMNSCIGAIKKVKAGDRLGYGDSYRAKSDITIAIIPIGYHEGLDRRLSNKGYFAVRGIKCPIVGRVSMNITSIDVSSVHGLQMGDQVQVVGYEPNEPNSIESIAAICKTIPQEILAHIPSHIPRIVK